MKNAKTKGPKTPRATKAAKPKADPRPPIDPAMLKDIGGFVDDPEAWFHRPNGEFEGRAPIELLGTPDEARLRNRIEMAKLGMFS
jgi:Protein of unknown function (DUF2384)